jgi:hypothetical protein
MAQTITVEDFKEFAARQREDNGRPAEYLPLGTEQGMRTGDTRTQIIFSNGAWSDGLTHRESPRDPIERLKSRVLFLETALAIESRNWHHFKVEVMNAAALSQRFANLPGISPADVQQLEEGVERIRWLRELIAEHEAELQAAIEASPPHQASEAAKRTREQLELQRAQRHHELLQQVKAITV